MNEIVYEKLKVLMNNVRRLENSEKIISPNLKADELISNSFEIYVKKYEFKNGLSKHLHEINENTEGILAKGPLVY